MSPTLTVLPAGKPDPDPMSGLTSERMKRVVAEASDGKQAVELIPQVKPDVVLMDMRMPVMSGLEALQAMVAKQR